MNLSTKFQNKDLNHTMITINKIKIIDSPFKAPSFSGVEESSPQTAIDC